jgi:hypothetical protein
LFLFILVTLFCSNGAVTKTGDDFKEKLRELGGLDAVFECVDNSNVFVNCLYRMNVVNCYVCNVWIIVI